MNNDFKENLKQQIEKGDVKLSSEDFSENKSEKIIDDDKLEDSKVDISDTKANDPVLKKTDKASDPGESMRSSFLDYAKSQYSSFKKEEVVITKEEKDAFIDALVTGKRFYSNVSLYDGRFVMRLRSRTSRETHAILTWLARKVNSGEINTIIDQGTYLRWAMIVAQVERVNEMEFPEMAEPLYSRLVQTKSEDGKPKMEIEPPAWEASIDWWSRRPEVMLDQVFRELAIFEAKYIKLVEGANDPNF